MNELQYLKQLEKECLQEVRSLNIPIRNYTLKIGRRKNSLGNCIINHINNSITIEVSTYTLKLDKKEIKDTLLHEMLHTVIDCNNHGTLWNYYASLLNRKYKYNITRLASREKSKQIESNIDYKFKLECIKCGEVIGKARNCNVVKYPNKYIHSCGGRLKRIK